MGLHRPSIAGLRFFRYVQGKGVDALQARTIRWKMTRCRDLLVWAGALHNRRKSASNSGVLDSCVAGVSCFPLFIRLLSSTAFVAGGIVTNCFGKPVHHLVWCRCFCPAHTQESIVPSTELR